MANSLLNQKFQQRFEELDRSFSALPFRSGNGYEDYVANGEWRGWATSAQSLIVAVFGENSSHTASFKTLHMRCNGRRSDLGGLGAIFRSAKADFEGGYVFNVEIRVSGEVFGDFVLLARQALSEGHKDVAAVLASAALEDALKRYAVSNGLDVTGQSMQEVVNALKGGGFVSGAQKSLLDTMPKLRNLALHAEWQKLSEPDVSSMIGFVEQFLLSNFS